MITSKCFQELVVYVGAIATALAWSLLVQSNYFSQGSVVLLFRMYQF